MSTWSSSGSSSRTSASRASSSAAAISRRRFGARSCSTAARSAGFIAPNAARMCVAPCCSSISVRPSASAQSSTFWCPRRRTACRPGRLRPSTAPSPGSGPAHRGVEHGGGAAVLADRHGTVQQLAEHPDLVRPLLGPAHVDQPGGDHVTGVDRGDPGHRQEDPPPPEHLHHQPEHPRRLVPEPQGHDHVADLADLVPVRVEHRQPAQPGHEHTRRRSTHACRLVRAPLVPALL